MLNFKTVILQPLRHLKQLPTFEVGKTEATLEALHWCVAQVASPVLGQATSQVTALPKPPAGTSMLCTPKSWWREGVGCNTPRPWAGSAAVPCSCWYVSQREGALISACGGMWTLTFPPSSSEGAKTSSQELGEAAMLACSSEGSRATLNTRLLAIHLAGEGFPELLAGEGGDH